MIFNPSSDVEGKTKRKRKSRGKGKVEHFHFLFSVGGGKEGGEGGGVRLRSAGKGKEKKEAHDHSGKPAYRFLRRKAQRAMFFRQATKGEGGKETHASGRPACMDWKKEGEEPLYHVGRESPRPKGKK